jgi:FkbM family methyltransferase
MAARVGPAGRVYAFEPFDPNADLLERSIAENRFGDRILFRRAAVGAATGEATLTFPRETLNSGGAYLLRDGAAPLTGNLTRTVPLVALDDLPMDRPVRLVKMDVEGAEPQVLRGARRLLHEDRPVVLSELHPTQLDRASGASVESFLALARDFGYRAHRMENGGPGAVVDGMPDAPLISMVLMPHP